MLPKPTGSAKTDTSRREIDVPRHDEPNIVTLSYQGGSGRGVTTIHERIEFRSLIELTASKLVTRGWLFWRSHDQF